MIYIIEFEFSDLHSYMTPKIQQSSNHSPTLFLLLILI